MGAFLQLMRPGDWLVLCATALAAIAAIPLAFSGGAAEKAVVKLDGQVVAELPLSQARTLEISGAIGITRIEVRPGRARVAADPGLHQYCVRQGWLTQANAIAICAPNHVSLYLKGRGSSYDTLSY